MKNFLLHCRCFRKPLLAALILAILPPLLPSGTARAAGLAEDHTVLYYLVEMQRRFKRNCGGESMPEAPSLNPSTPLRSLAEQSAVSGQSPADFANANGLAGIPFLAVTIQAGSPQDAFDRINAAQCPSLMNRDYHYIGAAKNGDQWTVFLAGAEPGAQPAAPGEPGLPAAPGAAEPAAPGAAEPAQPAAFSAPPAQPAVAEQPAAPPQPVVAEQPVPPAQPLVAAQPAAPIANPASPAQERTGAARQTYDPSPAAPVPVARVTTDGLGRPVGKPEPLSPSATPSAPYAPAPATPYSPPPAPYVPPSAAPYAPPPAASPAPGAAARPIYVPPGGAGPVNDPAAPAAPVVVKEFEVSPTGKILGPVQPGSSVR